MIRWTTVSLCCAALFLVTMLSHSQQAPSEIQRSEAAYPNSSEGLQKLLHDTVVAVKSKDMAKAAALMNTLIVPADSTWFEDEFGPAFGPRLAAAYQKTKPEMEVEIATVFKGNADRGWMQPKIFRYEDAATVDSPTDRFLNCMDKVVPLYKTAFDGNRTSYQLVRRTDEPGRWWKIVAGDPPGYYVYTGGSFRFVSDEILFLLPKERPIRVQLDMAVMRPKVTNDSVGGVASQEKIEPLANQHIHGKVVIHFVLDTNGKIKKINVVEGSTELAEPFLQVVKQWTFEPTTLDGEPVEVDVNLETGRQRNGKWE